MSIHTTTCQAHALGCAAENIAERLSTPVSRLTRDGDVRREAGHYQADGTVTCICDQADIAPYAVAIAHGVRYLTTTH